MPVILRDLSPPEPVWVNVPLPGGEHFEVLIRTPTFEEQNRDFDWYGPGRSEFRIKTLVLDWREVHLPAADGAEPVPAPYSYANLVALLNRFPMSHYAVAAACRRRFHGIPDPEPSAP